MRERYNLGFKTIVLITFFILLGFLLHSTGPRAGLVREDLAERVDHLMAEGNIPGLCLVMVKGDEPVIIKGFGYANLEKKIPVNPGTLFELASCSKAFTGLAALRLESRGLIDLDAPVSKYLPWFWVTYDNRKYPVTLRQLLHHTSGIPTSTLSKLPRGNAENALEQTVKNLVGTELTHEPGTHYEYATVNYDIIGAVIQEVSGMTYEDYMTKEIFRALDLTHTSVGVGGDNPPEAMAAGYKIGFFSPRRFEPPVYRGNNPAAYIVSNGRDMARWLKLQLGLAETSLKPLIEASHSPDLSVRPADNTLTSYAVGWIVNQYENGGIFHTGLNPNFTAYIHFNPKNRIGVAVLANSNSRATFIIGDTVKNLLYGQEAPVEYNLEDSIDKSASVISIILGFCILGVLGFFISLVIDLFKGRRQLAALTWRSVIKLALSPLLAVPFLLGIYLIPRAMSDVSWETAIVWSPISFQVAILLILLCMVSSYIGYLFSTLFPQKNEYLKSAPMLIILSLLTGGANAVIIFLITGSLYSHMNLIYQVYFFGLIMALYILGRKVLQTKLIKITFSIVYDLRMKLIEKVFYTSYENFEKIERGRVFATLNNDTGEIGGTAHLIVGLITSIITGIGAFIFLATIAFWATMVTLCVVVVIASMYYIVSQRASRFFEDARSTQNVYMDLLNGLIDGFKELSLHLKKKNEYKNDIEANCEEFRQKSSIARIKYLHAFLVGESLLIVVLGAVGFAVPRLFTGINTFTLMSFIMVLLYLIGPINAILNTIPNIMQLKVAWDRVREFLNDIPGNTALVDPTALEAFEHNKKPVEIIETRGLMFQFKSQEDDENEEKNFAVGPVDFSAKKGEVIFIIGGNGSGKTTLAKVLTGLYTQDGGSIKINGKEVPSEQLGEYFSAVFGDYHLFQKIYEVDLSKRGKEAHHHLRLLRLEDKVEFVNNSFSTIDLSGGQRKRLALLQCYLEDSPIFLFDEVAADQDPTFRRFFYRDLLSRMRKQGKIVIAITHDDHYFDAADRVIKMDMGKIESIESGSRYKIN